MWIKIPEIKTARDMCDLAYSPLWGGE